MGISIDSAKSRRNAWKIETPRTGAGRGACVGDKKLSTSYYFSYTYEQLKQLSGWADRLREALVLTSLHSE